ncbi:MAG: hypothetical protein J7M18_02380 [Candidatus Eremiobacteraeota bacterium]|nr:hypothetical protein [Candidatus Eremiobacteraeota bacterium]
MKRIIIFLLMLAISAELSASELNKAIMLKDSEREKIKAIMVEDGMFNDLEVEHLDIRPSQHQVELGYPGCSWKLQESPRRIYKESVRQYVRYKDGSFLFDINYGYFDSNKEARKVFSNKIHRIEGSYAHNDDKMLLILKEKSPDGKMVGDESYFREIKHRHIKSPIQSKYQPAVFPIPDKADLIFLKGNYVIHIGVWGKLKDNYKALLGEIAWKIEEKIQDLPNIEK